MKQFSYFLECSLLGKRNYTKYWVTEKLLGVELDISSKPPDAEGFVPFNWRWVSERAFGLFNFFRRLDEYHEETTQSAEAWVLWQHCQVILNRLS